MVHLTGSLKKDLLSLHECGPEGEGALLSFNKIREWSDQATSQMVACDALQMSKMGRNIWSILGYILCGAK